MGLRNKLTLLGTSMVLFANATKTTYAYSPKIQVESGGSNLSTPEDVVDPEITSFKCPSAEIDVSEDSQVITCEIEATDDLSGIEYISVGFYNEKKNKELYLYVDQNDLKEGDFNKGTFTGKIEIPKGIEPGNWRIVSSDAVTEKDLSIHVLSIGDVAGNIKTYDTETINLLGFETTLNIIADEYDDEAPEVQSITCSPSTVDFTAEGNERESSKRIKCQAVVTEKKSDISTIEAYFVSPSGKDNIPLYFTANNAIPIGSENKEDNENSNRITLTNTVQIPKGLEAGNWTIAMEGTFALKTSDKALNTRIYASSVDEEGTQKRSSSENIEATPLTLIGPTDTEAPGLSSLNCNPTEFNIQDEGLQKLTCSLIASDDVSGVDKVVLKFGSPVDESEEITVLFDTAAKTIGTGKTGGAFRSSIDVSKVETAGLWQVKEFTVTDKLGNMYSPSKTEMSEQQMTTFLVFKDQNAEQGENEETSGSTALSFIGHTTFIVFALSIIGTIIGF